MPCLHSSDRNKWQVSGAELGSCRRGARAILLNTRRACPERFVLRCVQVSCLFQARTFCTGTGDLRSLAVAILRRRAAVQHFPRPSVFPIPDAAVAQPSARSPSLPNQVCKTHWRRLRFPKDRCRRANRHQARSHNTCGSSPGFPHRCAVALIVSISCALDVPAGTLNVHITVCISHLPPVELKTTIEGSVSKAELTRSSRLGGQPRPIE